MPKILPLLFLLLLLFPGVSCAQDREAIENGLVRAVRINGEAVKTHNILDRMALHHVPGVSIAVIRGDSVHWAKGYGIANSDLGTVVDENTLFQAGSISKPIAALAALKLADQGTVDLDLDVNQYLSRWKIPDNEFNKNEKVTLRRILSHTAGLTVHGFPGYTATDSFPSDLSVLNGKGNTPPILNDAVPGATWRYSGGGYTVMENIIEEVSGKPFHLFMRDEILNPLGMSRSTYEQPLPTALHHEASGAYDATGTLVSGWWHNYPEQAAAGLWTTPSDLARYMLAIQSISRNKQAGILSVEMTKEMVTRQKNNWGLGPKLAGDGDSLLFGHGGKNAGFTNDMIAWVKMGEGVVIMTNGDNGGRIIAEIYRAMSREYGWNLAQQKTVDRLPLDDIDIQDLPGNYQLFKATPDTPDITIEIAFDGEELIALVSIQKQSYRMIHTGKLKFTDPDTSDEISFVKAGDPGTWSFIWNGMYRFVKMNAD